MLGCQFLAPGALFTEIGVAMLMSVRLFINLFIYNVEIPWGVLCGCKWSFAVNGNFSAKVTVLRSAC